MPFPYPKTIILESCNHRPINCRETARAIGVNNRLKAVRNLVFT